MKLTHGMLAAVLPFSLTCCMRDAQKAQDSSAPLNIVVNSSQALNDVKDPATAKKAATDLGYLGADKCHGGLRGGEEMMFATGWGPESETGQASGIITKRDGGFFFDQLQVYDLGTRAEAPGIAWGMGNGQSSWELASYFAMVCQVAFNLDRLMPTPLYQKASAAVVSMTGASAGLSHSQAEVLQIKLTRATQEVGADLTIYLKKGFGLVALEYEEHDGYHPGRTSMSVTPGTVRLYVNDAGGTGKGTGPTLSEAQIKAAAMAKADAEQRKKICVDAAGEGYEWDGASCFLVDKSIKTEEACKKVNGFWTPSDYGPSCYQYKSL